jgi:hypothetical protein
MVVFHDAIEPSAMGALNAPWRGRRTPVCCGL